VRTARDGHVWKVRVLLKVRGKWEGKTFFYSRPYHVDDWKKRAEQRPDHVQIDFIGKYTLEEDSGE
jgi:hypothetical protein